jgi:hypothetical protein
VIRVLPRVALAIVLVAGLGGCGISLDAGQPSGPPTESPAPDSFRDDRCDGLTSAADSDWVWEGGLQPGLKFPYGALSTLTMQGTALVQSEALICSWDDQDGDPAAFMIVMGEGEEGYRRSEPSFADPDNRYLSVPILDGAYLACERVDEDSLLCHWNVLHGSDWISLFVRGIPLEDLASGDLAGSQSAGMVSALAQAVGELDIPKTPSGTPNAICTERLSPATLAEPLGMEAARIKVVPGPTLEESFGHASPQFGVVMWKYAYELLGYSTCGIVIDGGAAIGAVMISTNSAAILQDSSAMQPDVVEIEGLGQGIETCMLEDSPPFCTVAVVVGEDLFLIQFNVPSDMDGAAMARAALGVMLD